MCSVSLLNKSRVGFHFAANTSDFCLRFLVIHNKSLSVRNDMEYPRAMFHFGTHS